MSTPFGPQPPAQIAPPSAEPVQTPEPETQAEVRALTPTLPARPASEAGAEVILDPQPFDEEFMSLADEPPVAWWNQSDSLMPGMLLAFGVFVGLFVMLRMLRRKQMTRPVAGPPDERLAAIHERATSSIGPIERSMAEGEQFARRLAATMENKAARLELLIEEADRKLEELNRAVSQASRSTPINTTDRAARTLRSIDPAVLDRARVEQDRAERHVQNGQHETGRLDAGPLPEPKQADAADPVHRRVWALADDGMPPLDIARSLNQPVGQVELILNLRKSG